VGGSGSTVYRSCVAKRSSRRRISVSAIRADRRELQQIRLAVLTRVRGDERLGAAQRVRRRYDWPQQFLL